MSVTEESGWTKDSGPIKFRKSVSLDSPLGQRVLHDLAVRYPHFKPKYIDQLREYDYAPFDMLVATVIGPEDIVVNILDDNGMPLPQENHKDIASVTYILAGNALGFGHMYTFYDIATKNQPSIPADLQEFYELYQQFEQTFPAMFSMIERFATIYEKQITGYNGKYEPLALRELLWNFAQALIGAIPGQDT